MRYIQKLFRYTSFAGFVFILLGVTACKELTDKEKSSATSYGKTGEITVIMDSSLWKGAVGDSLRAALADPVAGLLRNEPDFLLRYVSPDAFSSLLRRQKNLLFVTQLDSKSQANQLLKRSFSRQSLERIQQDSSLFMVARQDEFARGQKSLHLFGATRDQLLENISENKEKIRQQFSETERKRLQQKFAKSEATDLISQIENKYKFHLDLPAGFSLAKSDSNFVWVASPGKEVTMYIFAAYKPYTSTDVFKPVNIIAWRDSIGAQYTNNPKIKDSYLATQGYDLPSFRQVSFNGKFAVETRGLWKLKNNSRGGPFLSYTFVDESRNRLYYLEGFVLAPSVDNKREIMREVEAILWTFQPVGGARKPANAQATPTTSAHF